MKQKVKLYDPHPGIGGALLPLPVCMKEIADELNGQTMTLEKTVELLDPIAEKVGGRIEVVKEHKSIRFLIEGPLIHSYRLLRYK